MLAHIILSLVCVFSSLFCSLSNVNSDGLKKVLYFNALLIFFFLALRYDFGNDYLAYYDLFNEFSVLTLDDALKYDGRVELGWILLCMLFKPIGFFGLVFALVFFQIYVLVKIIFKYCPPGLYWFAIFIFVFLPDNMLINASAIRQSIAISFFLLMIDSILEKKYLKALFYFIAAYNFHTSILIVVLFLIPIIFSNRINNYIFCFVALLIFPILYLFGENLGNYFFQLSFFSDTFEKYLIYSENGNFGSGVGTLYNFILLVSFLSVLSGLSLSERLIVKIASLTYFITPLSIYVAMLGRINFYFEMLFIVAMPLMVSQFRNTYFRYGLIFLIMFWTLYIYYGFYHNPIWMEKYSIYKLIPIF